MSGLEQRNSHADEATRVCVIDAEVGNLGNVSRAFDALGVSTEVTNDPTRVAEGRCLVLPGVGAFRTPRERLRGALEEAVRAALDEGAWLLGICIGFQLLFDSSSEFGETDGLSLVRGRIEELPSVAAGERVPLPHIGWNRLRRQENLDSSSTGAALLAGIPEESYAYFVHSFAPTGVPPENVVATCLHGREFPAIVAHGRVLGTQFHPERSGAVGLRLLENFLSLSRGLADEAA